VAATVVLRIRPRRLLGWPIVAVELGVAGRSVGR
jgi:hypothetical protein